MANKDWQKDARESAHRIWLAGLGALATAEQEGSKLFSTLVNEGERFQSKGKVQWDEVRNELEQAATKARRGAEGALGKLEEGFDEQVARTLHRVGVPTREEIAALGRRVEELTHAVERLRARQERATAGARGGGAGARTGASGRAAKPAAAGSAAGRPGGASGAKKAARKASPLPKKITTTRHVITTADVKTRPR